MRPRRIGWVVFVGALLWQGGASAWGLDATSTQQTPPVQEAPRKSKKGKTVSASEAGQAAAQVDGSGKDSVSEGAVAQAAAQIDALVFGELSRRGLRPAEPCSDEVFVRRLYVDFLGTIPRPQEAREFLARKEQGRRQSLINALLRRPEFTEYWALKWSDLLRVKAEFPINLWPNAAQAYHHWLRDSVSSRMPITGMSEAMLCSSGSNFRVGPVNFLRAVQKRDPRGLSQATALFFLGERTEKWPPGRWDGFALFFSQVGYKATGEWKEEIVYHDSSKAPVGGLDGILPDGTRVHVPAGEDPRRVVAAWLRGPGLPAYRRAMANRVWSWLMGHGIVHEPDDMGPHNPPTNPALLDFLAEELGRGGDKLAHLFRVIAASRVYQLSSIVPTDDQMALSLFAAYPVRRLDAEVLIDAICQITGSTEQYVSAIPEPYTYSPQNLRSIALPDGSITSPFLQLFGRPARDTGLESERNNTITAMQRLHLLNSPHIRQKLEKGSRIAELANRKLAPDELADLLCLTVLSRHVTEAERPLLREQLTEEGKSQRERIAAVLWALINGDEFLHRH